MAEDLEDPREVPWHPRYAESLKGHGAALQHFEAAFAAGRPHHAWLITGPMGIGKATLAYKLAMRALSHGGDSGQTTRWVHARSHPDLGLLERSFNDSKPKRLRAEISVDDVRQFGGFFERTASTGGWKVGIVDCVDDLNAESANALLKLVEEPPVKSLLLLVCHQPGRALRTLRSRCLRLPLKPLAAAETRAILEALPVDKKPTTDAIDRATRLSGGSPGQALQLLNSTGAKAFDQFAANSGRNASTNTAIASLFSSRAAAVADFEIFMDLLLNWLAGEAAHRRSITLAELHAQLGRKAAITTAYNLDRRVAVLEALTMLEGALKAA